MAAQNNLAEFKTATTMSSREIAELTGKEHKNVLADVRAMLEELSLSTADFSAVYKAQNGQEYEEYRLDRELTETLLTGYSVVLRLKVIRRWRELESVVAQPGVTLQGTQALSMLRVFVEAGAILNLPTHKAQIEAVKQVRITTGVDFGALLLSAPAQNDVPDEEVMLEPTDMGKAYHLSGIKMNQRLRDLGLQIKIPGGWARTEEGAKISARHQFNLEQKQGYNWIWNVAEVHKLMLASGWTPEAAPQA